jgi:hypothetical protein
MDEIKNDFLDSPTTQPMLQKRASGNERKVSIFVPGEKTKKGGLAGVFINERKTGARRIE